MKQRMNFLSDEMRRPPDGSSRWVGVLIALLITAVLAGSGVYFFQKNNIEMAKAALKERDSMRQEILTLKQQLNGNTQSAEFNSDNTATSSATQSSDGDGTASLTDDKNTETGSVTYDFKYIGIDKTSKYWEPVFTAITGAQKIILSRKATETLSKNKETVSNFFAPKDLMNKDIIYVSSFIPTSTKQFMNYAYSYNVKSGELKKVYSKLANLILKTLGITEKGVVFAAVKTNGSLGQCYSIWAGHDDSLYYYLDTSGAKPELKSFALPKDKIDQGRQEEADCLSKK
ncbi:hypothetical protein KKA13_02150 [Patescibacteria group bacterium]|nr:hypothetical protein [Patescibacteria group bacterium]MBU1613304.1 hypothetical protein [Patescibacteria group bacterium]